jgi:hypothetical protein
MMQMGQIGGVAAALCVRDNVQPRSLDVRKLQETLLKLNYCLGDSARLQQLGLSLA